jgi:hypothetical protein
MVGGTKWLAHRAMFVVTYGDVPERMMTCHHRCDVRACINPDHLFLGDALANAEDRDAKGRAVNLKGSENGNAVLNEDQVREIMRQLLQGRRVTEIARQNGVPKQTIGSIKHGQSWTHLWPTIEEEGNTNQNLQ